MMDFKKLHYALVNREPSKQHQVNFVPILMSAPMMVANLGGFKHVTRRKRGLDKVNDDLPETWSLEELICEGGSVPKALFVRGGELHFVDCPYGAVGDYLWMRENFRAPITQIAANTDYTDKYKYQADYSTPGLKATPASGGHSWKPSIHMPKRACRMFGLITEIRVERLGDILPYECWREGILNEPFYEGDRYANTYRSLYEILWEQINGEGSWERDRNKFIWAISYKAISERAPVGLSWPVEIAHEAEVPVIEMSTMGVLKAAARAVEGVRVSDVNLKRN